MATNFPRADNYTTPSGSQINLYGAQQMSPVNSASATPMNVSPTSPRNPSQLPHLPLHTRQLRPPKSPLYVPAVLRPTERPIKQSPLTPPRSVHGSLDSLDGVDAGKTLSRRSTAESMKKAGLSRVVEGERTGESAVGTVTGLPTREHWKVSVLFEIYSLHLFCKLLCKRDHFFSAMTLNIPRSGKSNGVCGPFAAILQYLAIDRATYRRFAF